MLGRVVFVAAALSLSTACVSGREFHGYLPDQANPNAVEPGVDSRSSVLAQLGTPSTTSIFDDNTWIYMSSVRTRRAFFKPKVTSRNITAVKFGEDDFVAEVLQYDLDDGEVINYASRATPTRGRELGLLEQIFGSVGVARLPIGDEITPGDPIGRGR